MILYFSATGNSKYVATCSTGKVHDKMIGDGTLNCRQMCGSVFSGLNQWNNYRKSTYGSCENMMILSMLES